QCRPTRPPKHTALFPEYSTPGGWCRRANGPHGQGSQCTKGKDTCEWYVRITEASVGAPKSACEYREDATCASLELDGDIEYQCAITSDDCNIGLASFKAEASTSPVSMTDFSTCEPWKFEADASSRVVPRPTKKRQPGLTLVFSVDDDNPDPIRTVK